MAKNNILANTQQALLTELSHLIEQSQQQIVSQANSTLTLLFWHIGKRIHKEILQNKRADYGKRIVPTVSAQLEERFGRNFTEKNVRRMLQFAEQFPDNSIVATLSRQLSWSHFSVRSKLQFGNEQQSNRSIKHACHPPNH